MSDLDKEVARGVRAESILGSDIWNEAWEAYRQRIFEEIDSVDSRDEKTLLHLKMLLSAAKAAKGHLELIMKDGKAAAFEIEMRIQEGKLARLFSKLK